MIGDYLRAAAGFVPIAAILAIAPVGTSADLVLGGLAVLFCAFGIRTALRHGTRVEMTETGLRASGPLGASIRWAELDQHEARLLFDPARPPRRLDAAEAARRRLRRFASTAGSKALPNWSSGRRRAAECAASS